MRDWLKKKYPEGLGLGDLLYEYESVSCNYDTESSLRRAEIRSVLSYMYRLDSTPVFSDEFGTMTL